MKKFLLGTVGLVALSLSAPASAADLAARPYTKAPPPMIAAIYDWSGFYVGLNGGWGSSHKCWDIVPVAGAVLLAEGCHDATGGTIGGQIGYRWQASNWVFGLEAQGNWADFAGQRVSQQFILVPGDQPIVPHADRRLRPVHRPDRLRLEQRPAVRQGRRCRHRRPLSSTASPVPMSCSTRRVKPAGVA